MERASSPIVLLALDVSLLVFGLFNIFSLSDRASPPFEARTENGLVVVANIRDPKSAGGLHVGDEIVSWNGLTVTNPEMLEILGDLSAIGKSVTMEVRTMSQPRRIDVTLIPFYSSPRFMLINLFVGFVVWCVGVFALVNQQKSLAGATLHWLMISLATIILTTWGPVESGAVATVLKRIIFFVSYALVGAFFLFFTTIFPKEKLGSIILKRFVIFGPAVVFFVVLSVYYIRATAFLQPEDFSSFQITFALFHILVAVYALAGVLSLVHSYRTSETRADKARLQWILWGFAVGPTPFVVLIALPQAFGPSGLVPEEYGTVFLLAAPLSLIVSLHQYRLFDIELVINRSIVYTLLTVFIGAVYVLSVVFLVSILGGERVFTEFAFIIVVTLVIAFAFNPIRGRLQRFVDETLFPARANFRKVITQISQQLQRALSSSDLFGVMIESVQKIIPFNAVAVYTLEPGKLVMRESRGDPLNETLVLKTEHIQLFTGFRAFARKDAIDFRRDDVDQSKEHFLRRFDCALCIPLLSEARDLLGVLAARPSSRTGRFSEEEIDLLETICAQTAEVLERLNLQEKVILEQEERKKIEELNRLKSYFVSSVSHELRTPLTSIKMFAETLRTLKDRNQSKRKEYLEIIEGESDRLARLIDNVLDFAKIERGVKEYHLSTTNINDAVSRAVRAMKYQFAVEGASLRVRLAKRLPVIQADADAIMEVVMNLLSNALKYSSGKKRVALNLFRHNSSIILEVSDNGLGIPKVDIGNIFEPFFRVRTSGSAQIGGAGLGLALVKHIVDAHQGKINVTSAVGKGSVFRVELPIITHEDDSPR